MCNAQFSRVRFSLALPADVLNFVLHNKKITQQVALFMDQPTHTTPPKGAKAETSRNSLLTSTSLSTPVAGMRTMWGLISAYWRSSEKKTAWLLIGALGGLIVTDAAMAAGMTFVVKNLTDAFQARDILTPKFAFNAAVYYGFASFGLPLVSATRDFVGQMWQIQWEGWLTKTFKKAKDMNNAMLHIMNLPGPVHNPDQIITEGTEKMTAQVSGLGQGLFSAVVKLATFTGVLYAICDTTTIEILNRTMTVPGQSFWYSMGAAMALAGAQTWFNKTYGKPLDKLNFNQTVKDAVFRTLEQRLLSNAGTILGYGPEAVASHGEDEAFEKVQQNRKDFARAKYRFNFATRSFSEQSSFGYFAAGGVLFSLTKLSWGQGTQLANTVGELQRNLAWLGAVVPDLSQAKAWCVRFVDLAKQIELAQNPNEFYAQQGNRADIRVYNEYRDSIVMKDIVIDDPSSHKEILSIPELEIKLGRRYVLVGQSGCGKTCLLKIPMKQWYYGAGECRLPAGKNIMMATPYIIPGATLRQNIAFPHADSGQFSDDEYRRVLKQARLGYLIPMLGETTRSGGDWDSLSRGEKERLVFARAFLHKPDYLFMDEPTSAMDDALQEKVLRVLPQLLPNTAVVAVIHGLNQEILHNFTDLLHVKKDGTLAIHPQEDGMLDLTMLDAAEPASSRSNLISFPVTQALPELKKAI